MVWLECTAIALQFFSFWLVAPEILGEPRLRSWERALTDRLGQLPALFYWVVAVPVGVLAGLAIIPLAFSKIIITVGDRALDLSWICIFPSIIVALLVGLIMGRSYGRSAQAFVSRRLIVPLLNKLADDSATRQRALALGAALFVLSIMFQCIAVFGD